MELYLIPLVFALVAAISPKNMVKYIGLAGAVATLIATVVKAMAFQTGSTVLVYDPELVTSFGLTFKMGYDGMGLFMVLLTNVIVPIILLSNLNRKVANERGFNAMVLLMQVALIGVFTALDGILFYVFWELTLVPIFLIALWYGATDSKKSLVKFFIYTFVGSLAMLLSLMALGTQAADFSHESLVAVQLTAKSACWIMGGFFLAFAIKIPLFPFHTWQPATYTNAPMAGTMLLSGLMLKMALFGMIRWMIPLAPEALYEMQFLVITLGLIGIVYAAIIAIKQNDIKRIFAFASISHVGLIAAGLYSLTIEGFQGAVLQMLSHGLVIVGLFFVSEIIFNRWNTYTISEMGGIRSQATKFASFFMILVLASVAMPTTFNFVGEFTILYSLYNVNIGFAIVAGTTIILGAFYMLRMYQQTMLGETNTKVFADVTIVEGLVLLVIVGLVFFFGLYPKPIIELITPSLQNILNQIN